MISKGNGPSSRKWFKGSNSAFIYTLDFTVMFVLHFPKYTALCLTTSNSLVNRDVALCRIRLRDRLS